MNDDRTVHRRTVLERTGTALALTATMGTAAAGTGGDRWYVVVADGDAARGVARKGFDVRTELAGGDVLLVRGTDGETNRLASATHVAAASVDVTADGGPKTELTGAASSGGATDDAGAATGASSSVAPETTDEPHYDHQWDKPLIDLPEAHAVTTGERARIALLDSGVYADHPDLDVNEGLSRVVTRDTIEDREVRDQSGHGTHVAGIAAASVDDDVGVAGVAPDAELVSIRDVDTEDGESLSLARRLVGLEYAASIDADVASSTHVPGGLVRSLPPEARGSALAEASRRLVQQAVDSGTVVVQAAGNYFPPEGGTDFQTGGGFMAPGFVPAALTVGATGPTDERAYYSHYGLSYLDVAAPGGGYESERKTIAATDVEYPFPTNGILSTVKPGTAIAEQGGFPESDLYGYWLGTSMATPQAAGTAALVRSIAPDVNPYRVMQAIEQGAEGESGPDVGAGRLNAAKALDAPVLNGARE